MSEIVKHQRVPSVIRLRNIAEAQDIFKKSNDLLRFPYVSINKANTRNRVTNASKSVAMPPISQAYISNDENGHEIMKENDNILPSELENQNYVQRISAQAFDQVRARAPGKRISQLGVIRRSFKADDYRPKSKKRFRSYTT